MFLGVLRVTTILLFGGACLIIAPSCYNEDNAWYITPLGMFPLLIPFSGNILLLTTSLYSDCWRRIANALCRLYLRTLRQLHPPHTPRIRKEIPRDGSPLRKRPTTHNSIDSHDHEVQCDSPTDSGPSRRYCP